MLFKGLDKLKRSAIMTTIVLMFIGNILLILPEAFIPFLSDTLAFALLVTCVVGIFDYISSKKALIHYTMLIRSLVTIEGVLEAFCPELNLFDFLTRKMLERAKESFDVREKLTSALEALTATGLKTVRIPTLAFGVLQNLMKGRMKVNFELTGYDELLRDVNVVVRHILLAVFSCVLFSGSCTLCTTNIQPQANGVPLVALIGFVASIALAVYTVRSMVRKK